MEKKEWWSIGIVFGIILTFAVFQDCSGENQLSGGVIERASAGGDKKSVSLILNAEDILEDYPYELEIEPQKVTREQAELYFEEARQEIDAGFEIIDNRVPANETYAGGLVEADWIFRPYTYIAADGSLLYEEIPKEGVIINAEVRLYCGEYETLYQFSFLLKKPQLSKQEQLLEELAVWVDTQMETEGVANVQLPEELAGIELLWEEKREFLFWKVLFLEGLAIVVILVGKQKGKEKEEESRRQKLEEDYPDVVNQLTVLLGAGMTTRQAWAKISMQYEEKRKKNFISSREGYEEILQMSRQIAEGEKERLVYQRFADKMELLSYRRLMRLLVNNLEKGSMDLCKLLEEECRNAYSQRILNAKTKGEEASTKLLVPLMAMMLLIMAIVLLPAIIRFTG